MSGSSDSSATLGQVILSPVIYACSVLRRYSNEKKKKEYADKLKQLWDTVEDLEKNLNVVCRDMGRHANVDWIANRLSVKTPKDLRREMKE